MTWCVFCGKIGKARFPSVIIIKKGKVVGIFLRNWRGGGEIKMRVLKKKWRKEKESEIDQHVQPHPALHF